MMMHAGKDGKTKAREAPQGTNPSWSSSMHLSTVEGELQEPLLDTANEMNTCEDENDKVMESKEGSSIDEESSRESIMNQSGNWSFSTDGLGHPCTYEGDIATPLRTPRLPNGELVRSSNGGTVSWLTPAQAQYLQDEGRYVFSDEQVNQRRNLLQQSMPPSISEMLTPEVITAIVKGTLMDEQQRQIQVPLDPTEWNGVPPEEREDRIRRHEDSLLLGIDFEEMTFESVEEARALRAMLRKVREVEQSLNEQRAAAP